MINLTPQDRDLVLCCAIGCIVMWYGPQAGIQFGLDPNIADTVGFLAGLVVMVIAALVRGLHRLAQRAIGESPPPRPVPADIHRQDNA